MTLSLLSRIALTAACIGTAGMAFAQETPMRGGTAVFAVGSEPAGLNRNISNSNSDGLIACIVYQGLVDVLPSGEPIPLLARSWTISEDGRRYEFELNEANWSDGEPFTSADVAYTLQEISAKYSATFAGAARAIASIETPADDRVVLNLSEPYGPLLLSLGCAQGGAILPKHIFEGTDPATNPATTSSPVGTGPFVLADWQRGQFLRLTRNENYWEEGKPYLDEVIGLILPQAASRTQALLSRQVDFVTFTLVPSNDYGMLEQAGFSLLPSPVPSVDVMLINTLREDLSDPRVRQALLMATNREFLLQTAYNNVGTVANMPFTNRMPWAADPDTDYNVLYPYDPAAANALLDAAGKTRGPDGIRFRVTLNYLSDDQDAPLVSTAILSMWREIGVEVSIVPGERAAILPRIFSQHDFDLALVAYNSNGDPALGLARMFVSTSIGQNFGNGSSYSNPEVDALFIAGQEATDFDARGALYARAQAILGRDLPLLTLHERVLNSAVSPDLRGVDDEYYLPTWRNAWINQ